MPSGERIGAGKLAIERDGSSIFIELTCDSTEAAKAIYLELTENAREGGISLNVGTKPRETIDA